MDTSSPSRQRQGHLFCILLTRKAANAVINAFASVLSIQIMRATEAAIESSGVAAIPRSPPVRTPLTGLMICFSQMNYIVKRSYVFVGRPKSVSQ